MIATPDERAPGDMVLAERALSRAAQSRPVPGNRVELLFDGPEVFPAMLGLIESATSWVHFENYVIRSDETGWRFIDALVEAARRGVRVSVLYDWLGCVGTSRRLWRQLRQHGVAVRAFNPPRVLDVVANITRDHRKLVVADGSSAVIGGVCIGNEWAGNAAAGVDPWRDTAVEIHGPAAAVLDQSFAAIWHRAGGLIPPDERATDIPRMGNVVVQVVAGQPGRGRIFRILDLLAAGSSERMWITDAYLVAPRRLLYALRNAAREGVDVRLLVPSTSDVKWVRNLTRIGYRDLLRSGVRIYEWRGGMLHAKTQVADGRWSRIGSSNLNAASLLGNYELDILIDDHDITEALENQFRRDISHSAEIVLAPKPELVRQRRPPGWPARLAEHPPNSPPGRHKSSLRERRRRVVLTARTLANGARRSTFLPISVGLILLAGLFLAVPRVMGYIFGILLVWLAIGAWMEAFRRRGPDAGTTGQGVSTKPGHGT